MQSIFDHVEMKCQYFFIEDKLVPLPSIFFIGKNGAPLEIVTGVTKTADELSAKINGVLEKANLAPASSSGSSSANLIASELLH